VDAIARSRDPAVPADPNPQAGHLGLGFPGQTGRRLRARFL
jgi:hypothetical protein